MSVGNKKRKRDDSASEQPVKVQVIEKDDSRDKTTSNDKSRGKSRQEKSERRAKKAAKNSKKPSKKRELPEGEVLTPNATPQKKDDELANGQDFVSLFAGPDAPPKPTPSSLGEKSKKAKKDKVLKPTKTPKSAKQPRTLNDSEQQPLTEATEPNDPRPTPTTASNPKPSRFILFIGNLPFTATTTSITNHFLSLQPFTVRHSTEKNTSRSKGFAFLEFENYDRMKTCLKLYHHSMFDPDNNTPQTQPGEGRADGEGEAEAEQQQTQISEPKKKKEAQIGRPLSKHARRINVELTAGGGGKGKERKTKIQSKNQKLNEQRERRHAKETAEKAKNGFVKKERRPVATGANADTGEENGEGDRRGNIHPSRMQRVAR